ncbi:MAG: cyclase family protein [Clostridiales bacterium]|jgi:kynurenine formamidase|nr:cyclase family protein [Clostridiales bacterium]
MPRIIDLSHPITANMSVYPGDPAVEVQTVSRYEDGGYFVSRIVVGSHAGTHADAPVHKIPGAKSVTDMGIAAYIGFRCYVMDISGFERMKELSAGMVRRLFGGALKGCDSVLLKTGWSAKWGYADYYKAFPGIAEDTALYFGEAGIRVIGLETPSVNAKFDSRVHYALLSRDLAIVENLANLHLISRDYVEFHAVPLSLHGRDGSPVRAYAIER